MGQHARMHADDRAEIGAEGGNNPQEDTPPGAPSPAEDDSPLGDTDQHSKVPTPPAQRVRDTP